MQRIETDAKDRKRKRGALAQSQPDAKTDFRQKTYLTASLSSSGFFGFVY